MYNNGWGGWGGNYYNGGWGMMGGWDHSFLFGLMALAAPFVILFLLWSVVWKGLSLFHAARRGQYWWFMILLVVNTAGILDIIYLFFVAKLKWGELFSLHSHAGHEHNH